MTAARGQASSVQDWARITRAIERARTLDPQAADALLRETFAPEDTLDLARRLLGRVGAPAGFMQTSAGETTSPGEAVPTEGILPAGTRIGVWAVEDLIGRGGMGEVYRARRADGLYDQTVALKLIHGASAARAERFDQERRRLARMEHPGIARIVDGGAAPDGRAYLAMEFVDGTPVDAHTGRVGLDRRARLRLFVQLCRAVSHAHNRLILHRDIKADNVLVDREGQVRLIDFGIASDVDGENAEGVALTLASAAPEQLKGEAVSVETDVFALGVLLHQLLTDSLPERRADGGMTVSRERVGNADLVAILGRSMASRPEARYPSAEALQDDILAVLDSRPVSAREGGPGYRAARMLRRFPLASALAGAFVLALAGGLALSLKFASDARAEAARANDALLASEASLERAEFYLGRANLFHATQTAYADTLQSMFGGEADVARQTRILKARWREAYDMRADDPENAAYLSYAIGRHFVFRNDYPTAISILQPWVEEAYGPPDLVGYARQLLALAYMSTGREQDALPILRQTEAWFAEGHDAASPDHIAAATQIALITEAEPDIRAAEALLEIGLAEDHGSSINMYFWNQLSRMRQMRGDFAGAYEAMLAVVGIIEATPLMDVSGTDTGRLNLADFELWHTGDLDRAEALARAVLDTARETKGESREQGLAHAVMALIAAERGELGRALEEIDAGLALVARYGGEASDAALTLRLQKAEILAGADDPAARAEVAAVREAIAGTTRTPRLMERIRLAELYVTALIDGREAARAQLERSPPDRAVIGRSLQLHNLHQRLAGLGVVDGEAEARGTSAP